MAKDTFKFDKHTFEYNKTELTPKQKFFRVFLPQIFTGIAFGLLVFFIVSNYFVAGNVKKQKQELDVLEENYKKIQQRRDQATKVLSDIKKRDKNIHRSVFEAEPIDEKTKNELKYRELSSMTTEQIFELINSNIQKMDSTIRKDKQKHQEMFAKVQNNHFKQSLEFIPSIQPIYNPDIRYIPYGYGTRLDPIYRTPSFHHGIDFAAPRGTPVRATAPGKVIFSKDIRTHGETIVLDHGNGFKTKYAHLDKRIVMPGIRVERGDVIGYVGNTGKSLVAHIHYEVIVKDEPVNPVNFFFQDLGPKEFKKIVELSMNSGLSLD